MLLTLFGLMDCCSNFSLTSKGIDYKFWLILKDLYTDDIHAKVLCGGSYFRTFKLLQGSEQGRILAPFIYKVYINGLLKELSNRCLATSINQLKLNPPTFADDCITLLALHPSFCKPLRKCVIIIVFYGNTISTILKAELLCMVKPNQFTSTK